MELWLARWTSDLKVGGSTPSPCHRVVSLDKILFSTLSLSTQVYKMMGKIKHINQYFCFKQLSCGQRAI